MTSRMGAQKVVALKAVAQEAVAEDASRSWQQQWVEPLLLVARLLLLMLPQGAAGFLVELLVHPAHRRFQNNSSTLRCFGSRH